MFIIYRILFLAFTKIQMVRITTCQIPTTQDFPPSYWGGFFPLKNTGDGSIYIPPKLQRVEIFFSESTSYVTLMKNNTTSKRKASLQCPPTLPAGGGGLKICYVCQKERGLALFEFLKAEWIFPGGGRGGWEGGARIF